MLTRFRRHKGIVVAFTPDGPLAAADFAEWERHLREPGVTGFLSGAVGTIRFTSTQRRAAADLARSVGFKTAVVTDDVIGRGIATAVGWLGARIKAFSWSNADEGAAYLGIEGDECAAVAQMLWALRTGQRLQSVARG